MASEATESWQGQKPRDQSHACRGRRQWVMACKGETIMNVVTSRLPAKHRGIDVRHFIPTSGA